VIRIHRNAIFAALVLLPLLCGATLRAQRSSESESESKTAAEVSFAFERTGLPVPRFTLTVNRNGLGTYTGDQAQPVVRGVPAQPATLAFERKFALSSQTTRRIFALADELEHFNIACAAKAMYMADTGTKTLTYAAPGTTHSCTYNYTENKNVSALTGLFLAIAETMDEGRALDHLHRYDRLGLDAELQSFSREVAEGRAVELGTIASTLRAIAEDADLMQRVRTQARALLTMVSLETRQSM
jgi:hypothetical protein